MDASLESTWNRFVEVSLEHLQPIQVYLQASLRGSSDATMREYALSNALTLGDRFRGVGLSEASRYAEKVAELLARPEVRPEELAPWLLWLRREFNRQTDAAALSQAAFSQLWLCAGQTAYADALTLAARRHGMRVLNLQPSLQAEIPQGFEMIIVQQDFTTCLNLLEQLRERLPSAFLLAVLNRVPFEDRVALSLAGADLILTQATAPDQVLELMVRKRARGAARGSRILLVEDDRVTRRVLERILVQGGYQVRTLEGQHNFGASLEEFRPDLVILDYLLPEGPGTDLCLALRSDSRWNSLPVLFLTASRDSDTVSKVFAAGADDFLAKPVDSVELLGRLRNRLLRSRELRLQGDVDPRSQLPGRHATLQMLSLLTKLARRQQLSASLALFQLRGPGQSQPEQLSQTAQEIRQTLRRPGDLLGSWDQDTLLLGLYDTRREACKNLLERLLQSGVSGAAAVASCPADGADFVALLAPLQECLQTCPDGTVMEVGRRPRQLHIAVVSGETPEVTELVQRLRALHHRVEVIREVMEFCDHLAQSDWKPERLLLDLSLPKIDTAEIWTSVERLRCPLVAIHPPDEGTALKVLGRGVSEVLAAGAPVDQLEKSLNLQRP